MQCADRNFQAFVEDKVSVFLTTNPGQFLQNQLSQLVSGACGWWIYVLMMSTFGFACNDLKSDLDLRRW
ncbi:hypothetical protein QYF36_010071 [Acer negundo]|nr:hypothetical protein QYF36_010071 [Acer negundo]